MMQNNVIGKVKYERKVLKILLQLHSQTYIIELIHGGCFLVCSWFAIKIENKLSGFGQLGLDQDLVMALEELNFITPTPVQKAIIPRILSDESIVVAAATGSGKTLAFVLPVLQQLIEQVRFMCWNRLNPI